MPQQLVYTSIARGLDFGRSGYCTAARTADMRKPLIAALEGFSRFDFAKGLPKAIFSFRVVELGADRFFVCSRTADCGFDYTGRTNFISHHVVFSEDEIPRFGSSADFAANWTGWRTSWNESARVLTDADFAPFTPDTYGDAQWRAVCGRRPMPLGYSKHLLFRNTGERVFLKLLAESMAREKSASWNYTWTTRLQNGESAREFNFILADAQTPETVAEFKNFDPATFVCAQSGKWVSEPERLGFAGAELNAQRAAKAADFDFEKLPRASRFGGLVLPISAFSAVLVVCGYLLFSQFSDDASSVEVGEPSSPKHIDVLSPSANDSKNDVGEAGVPEKVPSATPESTDKKPAVSEQPKPAAAPVSEKETAKRQIVVSAKAQKLKRILGFGGAECADIQCVVVFVAGKDTANLDGNVLGKLNNEIIRDGSPVKSGVLYKYPAEIAGVNYGILFIEDETKWASREAEISEICNIKGGKFGVDFSLFDTPHFYTSNKVELVFDWNITSPVWVSGGDLLACNVEKKRKKILATIGEIAELGGKIAAKEKEIAKLQPAEKSTAKLPEEFVEYLKRGNPELAKFAEHTHTKQFIKECYGKDALAADKLKGVPVGLNKERIEKTLGSKLGFENKKPEELRNLSKEEISKKFKAKNNDKLTELKTKIKGLFDAMNNIKSPDCSRYKDFQEQLGKIKDIAKFKFSDSTALGDFHETKKVISELNYAFTENEETNKNTLWKSIKNNKNDKKRDKFNAVKGDVNKVIKEINKSIKENENLFALVNREKIIEIADELLAVAEGQSGAQARLKTAQAEMEKLRGERNAKLNALANLLNRGGAAEELSADELQKIKAEVQNFKNSDVRGTVRIKFKKIEE